MNIKEHLENLIEDGEILKINGFNEDLYRNWKAKCVQYLDDYFKDSHIYNNFFDVMYFEHHTSEDVEFHLKDLRPLLNSAKMKNYISKQAESLKSNSIKKKIEKIFISHTTKDADYIKLFVQLLNDIGIPKSSNKIFCSSLEGYNIPIDRDIYEHIKEQFDESIRVIFMLSKNYYDSVACLNEMGATWINSKEYTTIFLPDFIPENIKGAINPNRIGFYLSDYEKLNSFRDMIIKEFDLKTTDASIWERDRDKFIDEVNNLIKQNKSNNSTSDIEMKIENIEEDDDGYTILLRTRITNKSDLDYKLKEFDLKLVDLNGNISDLTYKEQINIYKNENKVVNFKLSKSSLSYNANRNKESYITPYCTKL